MCVLLSCFREKFNERPWFLELVCCNLEPLEVGIALSAKPLAYLRQVFIIEHIVTEVELLNHLAILDARQDEVKALTRDQTRQIELDWLIHGELTDHLADLLG